MKFMKNPKIFTLIITTLLIVFISACSDDPQPQPHTYLNPPVTNQDEWIVNSNDYQYFMTIVAEIQLVSGYPACNMNYKLAAFSSSSRKRFEHESLENFSVFGGFSFIILIINFSFIK